MDNATEASARNTTKSPSSHQPNNGEPKCQISVIFTVSIQPRSGGTRKAGSLRSRSSTRRPASANCKKSSSAQAATFVIDLATRERGYGLIKSGVYDMKLTPVGSPPPPWPERRRVQAGARLLDVEPDVRRAPARDQRGDLPAGHRQRMGPVPGLSRRPRRACNLSSVSSIASRSRSRRSIRHSIGPVIKIVGWVERDKVPGWASPRRRPSRRPRPCRSCPRRRLRLRRRLQSRSRRRPRRAAAKPGPDDPLADLNDDIPWK